MRLKHINKEYNKESTNFLIILSFIAWLIPVPIISSLLFFIILEIFPSVYFYWDKKLFKRGIESEDFTLFHGGLGFIYNLIFWLNYYKLEKLFKTYFISS